MAFRLALNTSTLSFPSPPKMIVQSLLADLAGHALLAVLPPENDDFAIEDVPLLRGWNVSSWSSRRQQTLETSYTPVMPSSATLSAACVLFRAPSFRQIFPAWSARTISLFKTPFISSLATSSSRSDSFRINTCRNTRGYPSLPPAKLSTNLFKELLHVRSHQNCP